MACRGVAPGETAATRDVGLVGQVGRLALGCVRAMLSGISKEHGSLAFFVLLPLTLFCVLQPRSLPGKKKAHGHLLDHVLLFPYRKKNQFAL